MSDSACDRCGLKPWDADDLEPGDLVCPCDDLRELEPDFILGQFMNIAVGGDYVPGSIDGEPLRVAVWLEYGRRGGVEPGELAEYRAWLAVEASTLQVKRVTGVCAALEDATERQDHERIGVYLDQCMAGTCRD